MPSMFQMHGMENLDLMGDPSGSMTTLTPMSETPITSSHHQLHGSYHSMNHMMSHHHHGGPLSGHTPGAIFVPKKVPKPNATFEGNSDETHRLYKLSLFRLPSLGHGCGRCSGESPPRPRHRPPRARGVRRAL